jgi:glycosyltransferase involved in cell wall biosynthesis
MQGGRLWGLESHESRVSCQGPALKERQKPRHHRRTFNADLRSVWPAPLRGFLLEDEVSSACSASRFPGPGTEQRVLPTAARAHRERKRMMFNGCGMSDKRLSILVVAANASTRWAGEAILPLHIFRGLLQAGHDAWMCVGNETKPELDELLGPNARRVSYVEDSQMHSAFRWIQDRTPLWMGSNPLYYPQVLATQLRQRDAVVQLVKKLSIDVVHQPTPISPRVPSLLVDLPAPLVIGPMNGGMEYPAGFRYLQPQGVRRVKKFARGLANALPRLVDAKRQAACLIVGNQRTEDALPSGARGRIFRMIENGVIPDLWARERVAEEIGESAAVDRAFEIIFIGRLERWKGAEWLIDAVAGACRQVECRLKIIGDLRGERQRLAERVSELGIESCVEFFGWQSQERCAELLSKSDVLVLPSIFDPGATVVLEAMASGKAVIAVKWGGPADILDPSCGILIEPLDPPNLVADLEQAIVSLAKDRKRCASMGRAGQAKALAEYTWPKKIERFVEIYREAIRRRAVTQ